MTAMRNRTNFNFQFITNVHFAPSFISVSCVDSYIALLRV
jgi:hypothetical protein